MAPQEPPSRLRLRCAPDGLAVEVIVDPDRSGAPPVLASTIRALLDDRGVAPEAIDPCAVQRLAELAADRPDSTHEVVVARGTPVEPPEDGRVELHAPAYDPRDLTPRAPDRSGAELTPDHAPAPPASGPANEPADHESTDHYRGTTFEPVADGQLLATVHPPTPGTDGLDVFAKHTHAGEGTPAEVRTDDSIRHEGEKLHAARAGVLWITDGSLNITDELNIRGGVDFSTGNIDFPGTVRVAEGVADRFTVRAALDIELAGLIEAATIEAGRDAHVRGGMAGRGKGRIVVGRDLLAHYLDSTHATVARDCRVEREINQCILLVGGGLIAPQATLLAGRAHVAGSAELGTLGSVASRVTEIHLGSIPQLEHLVARGLELIQTLDTGIRQLEEETHAAWQGRANAQPRATERLAELRVLLSDYQTKRKGLQRSVDRMRQTLDSRTTVNLTVQRDIHRNATIVVGGVRYRVRAHVKGPVAIELAAGDLLLVRDVAANETTPIERIADREEHAEALDRAAPPARPDRAA